MRRASLHSQLPLPSQDYPIKNVETLKYVWSSLLSGIPAAKQRRQLRGLGVALVKERQVTFTVNVMFRIVFRVLHKLVMRCRAIVEERDISSARAASFLLPPSLPLCSHAYSLLPLPLSRPHADRLASLPLPLLRCLLFYPRGRHPRRQLQKLLLPFP